MSCVRGCCPTSAEHYRSIVISGAPSEKTLETRRDDADMDAYKRLRNDGHQPPGITGSANLEKAAHVPFEIESGRLTRNKRLAEKVQTIHEAVASGGSVTL